MRPFPKAHPISLAENPLHCNRNKADIFFMMLDKLEFVDIILQEIPMMAAEQRTLNVAYGHCDSFY